jgi:hypothetical protein
MDAEYAYTRKRMHFGKKCNFSDFDKMETEIKSDPALMSNYIRIDPVTRATQCSKVYAVHEVRTFLNVAICAIDISSQAYIFNTQYIHVAGEHNYRYIQRQQDVPLRGGLAERHKYKGSGTNG